MIAASKPKDVTFATHSERGATALLLAFCLMLAGCLHQPTSKVEPAPAVSDRDWQRTKDCAAQALIIFRQGEGEKTKPGVYMNHYAPNLGKCFVELANTASDSKDARVTTTRVVVDAYDGNTYGDYMWMSDPAKKYWQVPPYVCKVTIPSGEEKQCASEDEYKALTKVYMGDGPR